MCGQSDTHHCHFNTQTTPTTVESSAVKLYAWSLFCTWIVHTGITIVNMFPVSWIYDVHETYNLPIWPFCERCVHKDGLACFIRSCVNTKHSEKFTFCNNSLSFQKFLKIYAKTCRFSTTPYFIIAKYTSRRQQFDVTMTVLFKYSHLAV